MLKYGNRELRNLEEQVEANAQDIEDFKNGNQTIAEFGITVVGILATADELPAQGENYGDAYLIGSQTPYDMRVWTRDVANNTAKWVDLGAFPLQGPKGNKGDIGSVITAGSGEPLNNPTNFNQYYINTVTGYWYIPNQTQTGYEWIKMFTLKGEKGDRGEQGKQGVQGLTGPQGKTGPIGPQGQKGDKGDVGPAFNLQGTLASSSNLPTPTAAMQDKGYAYLIPDAQGTKHVWVIQGPEGGPFQWVDVGTAGVGIQGPKGTDGVGLNTLTNTDLTYGDVTVTYDTTDGIGINGTMRQTYDGTNHDSMMDIHIPLVPGDGIIIDKKTNENKVEVKIDPTANIECQTLKVVSTSGPAVKPSIKLNPLSSQIEYVEAGNTAPKYASLPPKSGTLMTSNNVKTLLGKSIVGTGNIDLYVHNMTFHLPDGNCYARWISSKNLVIDSLTDLKTVFGNTFKLPLFGKVPKSGGVAVMITETKLIMNDLEWSYSDFTITDVVTTV